MRRKPHSTSLVLLLVCIFAFWWGISVWVGHTTAEPIATATDIYSTAQTDPAAARALVVEVTKEGDTYTYSGELTMFNACDSFGNGISYDGTNDSVTVLLTASRAGVACAQAADNSVPTFSVSINHTGVTPQFGGVKINGKLVPAQLVRK